MMREKGFDPQILPSDVNEKLPFFMSKESAVMYLALKKALDVESRLDKKRNEIIIAADTIVYYDKIIGKPKDQQEAYEILSRLRGNAHDVVTGVALVKANTPVRRVFYESSKVFFQPFPLDELQAYVKTKEPYDKAGGYAIQGTFAKYIDHFEGDRDNIIGFPWTRIEEELALLSKK